MPSTVHKSPLTMLKKILVNTLAQLKYKNVKIHRTATISYRKTIFEGMNQIHEGVTFIGFLGYGSYICGGSRLSARIGRFCSIGRDVIYTSGTHPYKAPFVSTSPCFYFTNPNKIQNGSSFVSQNINFNQDRFADVDNKYALSIGNDVWVGDGAFFLGGITIGDGAVIMSRAVVTKDVPPYAIVGGVPARICGYRYDEDTIDWLLKIKWWSNSETWFRENYHLIQDIEKLKEYYSQK